MELFEKFSGIKKLQDNLLRTGISPFQVTTEVLVDPSHGRVEGTESVIACSNNYLGLTFDRTCITAAKRALDTLGTGTTGSRMASGNYLEHIRLENELARFFHTKHAIIFPTGFSATMGISSTIAGPGETILLDADVHASLYDGARLSGAKIIRFKHNDMADLDKKLARLGNEACRSAIIVEGIYSMLGDTAPLETIVALKQKYRACLVVDEAHSMGVLGDTGGGLTEKTGLGNEVDFIVGTFSKSLGAIGGYCVSNHSALEQVRFAARSYIFSASLPPSVVASTRAALGMIARATKLRQKLWSNAEYLYQGLSELGLQLGPETSPIIAVIIDDAQQALSWWRSLMQRGIYVNLIIPPATPSGYSLLRCSVSAAHSLEQIDAILDAFRAVVTNQLSGSHQG